MKAAVINKFGSPEVFEISDIESKPITDNQLLIKNYAASINPIDFKSRNGNHKYILGSNFPIVLGYDFAGEVLETGKNVINYKPGDKVYGRSDVKYGGTYAQQCISSENTLNKIPASLNYKQAAAIPLAGLTALQALRDKCNIKKGQKILIIGASGGVGHFAVQFSKIFGAECYAVCSSNNIDLINILQPDHHIDYKKQDYKKSGLKFDIVFDVAGKESYLTCKHMLNKTGIYITTLPRPKILVHKFVSLFNKGCIKTLLMKANSSDLEYVNQLVTEGKLMPIIDKTYSLHDIDKAHTHAEKGHTKGKIIIDIKHD